MRKPIVLAIVLALIGVTGWYWLSFEGPPVPASGQERLLEQHLHWGDIGRDYKLYVPEQLAESPPVVIVMHGSMGTAEQARAGYAYAFEALAEEHGFLVVYPEGFENHFNGCRRQGPYAANLKQIDDVGFLRAVIKRLQASHNANPAAVFATGISNGGQMALRLALEAPDLVAAVAPVVASLPKPGNMDCSASGEAVALLLMNGSADPMNPYEGGTVALYGIIGNRGEVLSSLDTARYWAELAGHLNPPEVSYLPDNHKGDGSRVEVTRWQEPGRKPVALYTLVEGGHGAPHPELRLPRLLGGSNRDINAAEEIWRFFAAAAQLPLKDSTPEDGP